MKHGMAQRRKRTSEYRAWTDMKQRCQNPGHKAYQYYGGRDIKVCECWNNFQNFLEDMGLRPESLTLDRKDNNGNYEPGNCHWTTHKEQQNNRRSYSRGPNKQRMFIAMDYQGTMVVSNNQSEFARQHGLSQSDISNCLHGKYKTVKKWKFRKI